MKITKRKTTVVKETTTYKLHPNVALVEVVENGVMKLRNLKYVGKTAKDGFGVSRYFNPVYNPNLGYLEETNPWWYQDRKKSAEWFEGGVLPENPEDIDTSKIVLASGYDHTFWTVDLEPIPVVVFGDYIEACLRSEKYDLEKLHQHLSKHKQVKNITPIEEIPYYNNDSGYEKCFTVMVLPTVGQLKEMKNRKDIFYKPWQKGDYLGMKQFWIGGEYY